MSFSFTRVNPSSLRVFSTSVVFVRGLSILQLKSPVNITISSPAVFYIACSRVSITSSVINVEGYIVL